MTYDVWIQHLLPENKKGWGKIAEKLTREQADVYEATLLFPTSIQPSPQD